MNLLVKCEASGASGSLEEYYAQNNDSKQVRKCCISNYLSISTDFQCGFSSLLCVIFTPFRVYLSAENLENGSLLINSTQLNSSHNISQPTTKFDKPGNIQSYDNVM